MNTHTAPHNTAEFPVPDVGSLKRKMLDWASRFNIFLFLDNQQYAFRPQRYECLLAVGVRNYIDNPGSLSAFTARPRWCFGHLAYDLKTHLHQLPLDKPDPLGFGPLHLFEPEQVLYIQGDRLVIEAPDPQAVWQAIQLAVPAAGPAQPVHLQPRMTRADYIQTIRALQQHIRRGDCYEINFCQEFFAEGAVVHPVHLFRQLSERSPAPFSALYRLHDRYLVSASPERFLMRSGNRLVAQPMKGTARRDLADAASDAALKAELARSEKERSENVMVVDLVRNDLAQVCAKGSVHVDELYGIYTFPQVHQMVSTVSGTLRADISFGALLQANFPMGSMTGAPKLRVMQLIDQYEPTRRGIFSGSVGYITPDGDFDWNVIIRSVMYRADTGYVSCQVGSGITFYADAEEEWEECLLKAAAIRQVLAGDR